MFIVYATWVGACLHDGRHLTGVSSFPMWVQGQSWGPQLGSRCPYLPASPQSQCLLWQEVSLCCSDGLWFVILLPLPPECQDHSCVPPSPTLCLKLILVWKKQCVENLIPKSWLWYISILALSYLLIPYEIGFKNCSLVCLHVRMCPWVVCQGTIASSEDNSVDLDHSFHQYVCSRD